MSKYKDYRILALQPSASDPLEPASEPNPVVISLALIKQLSYKNTCKRCGRCTGKKRRKLHGHIKNYITSTTILDESPAVYKSFEKSIYSSIKEKIKPWVRPHEVALAGTVSLSGFYLI